jgi:hypothetical protein
MTEKTKRRFMSKISIDKNGCWIWGGCYRKGYGVMQAEGHKISAHRLSWVLFHGEIPGGMEVCHKCDNPSCVNPEHLFLGTHKDNMDDCRNKSRMIGPKNFGSKNGATHLTEPNIKAIRSLYAQGNTQIQIAKQFRIGRSTVGDIVRKLSWK